jgi:hypothetical protein
MKQYPIQLGSAIMTLVDPHRGFEVEYNRWYERDHFYGAVTLGPEVLTGARFVARRQEKSLRRMEGGLAGPDTGTLLSLYWMVGDGAEHRAWSTKNVAWLKSQGRMSSDREVPWAFHLQYAWGEQRDPDGVPPELALDHRFPGLAVAVAEAAEGHTAEELGDWYRRSCAPLLLSGDSSVSLCLAWYPQWINDPMRAVPGGDDPASRTARWLLLVWFLDVEPAKPWPALADIHEEGVRASGLGRPLWASPFIAAVAGTDTYMHELWLA